MFIACVVHHVCYVRSVCCFHKDGAMAIVMVNPTTDRPGLPVPSFIVDSITLGSNWAMLCSCIGWTSTAEMLL
jgi:hypothetical protein